MIDIAMGPRLTVLIIEVSLFHRYIYTHDLYCNGTTTDCPYYRSGCPYFRVSTITGLIVINYSLPLWSVLLYEMYQK